MGLNSYNLNIRFKQCLNSKTYFEGATTKMYLLSLYSHAVMSQDITTQTFIITQIQHI